MNSGISASRRTHYVAGALYPHCKCEYLVWHAKLLGKKARIDWRSPATIVRAPQLCHWARQWGAGHSRLIFPTGFAVATLQTYSRSFWFQKLFLGWFTIVHGSTWIRYIKFEGKSRSICGFWVHMVKDAKEVWEILRRHLFTLLDIHICIHIYR